MKLYKKSAAELSDLLRQKEVSAVEVARDLLARTEQTEKAVGAYITLCADEALKQAADIDAKRAAGEPLSALAGIPISYKDNLCTAGVRTTCASRILDTFVPPYSATVAEKAAAAGLVMTGKVNLDEFAMGSSCQTSALQTTRNPHDLTRVPGGSSGGGAASVAAGQTPLSLGTDTGGSVRNPAAYCGVVGFKPTYGTVSRFGLTAVASSMDQIGVISRTVRDAALLFDCIRGHDPRDSTSLRENFPSLADALDGGVKGLRIALPKEYFDPSLSADVRDSVQKAAQTLASLGAHVEEISLPMTPHVMAVYHAIATAEASSNMACFDGVRFTRRADNIKDLVELYEKTRSQFFGEEVQLRILLGTLALSSQYYDVYYAKARLARHKIKQELTDALTQWDLLLTPVTASAAFPIDEAPDDLLSDRYLAGANLAGLPAIALPCGISEQNLPVGVQLIAPRLGEQTLLRAAAAFEQQSGYTNTLACVKGVDA